MFRFCMLIVFFLVSCGQSGKVPDNNKGDRMLAVEKYGHLAIKGAHLVDEDGNKMMLKGMSTHGLAWFPQYYNKEVLKWLKEDWNSNVIRVAMYTEGYGGYVSNKGIKSKVYEMVDAAIELGIYVIVDWHILSDGNPMTHKSQAIEFFSEVSKKYKDSPNVIYEICNEPNGWGANWETIKAYAQEVIPIIRVNAPKAVVVVGTPTWSQDIYEPTVNPLSYSNIAYALHFYSGTHGAWLRDRITFVMNMGYAIFVTEWGMTQASGSGGVYYQETERWLKFLEENKISWANWSIANKEEDSAALQVWAKHTGGWPEAELTNSGKFVREYLKAH